jgi:hypothetical protein
MKSLGKQDVTFRIFLDGRPPTEQLHSRVVYTDSKGNLFINDLGRKRRIEQRDGQFIAVFKITSIAVRTFADVLRNLS